jgi:hypothetical protein
VAFRRRRPASAFSWSFLDVMASGFGATLLIWLVMDHQRAPTVASPRQLTSEVRLLEEDIREGELGLVQLRNAIQAIDDVLADARGNVEEVLEQVRAERPETPPKVPTEDPQARIVTLQREISELEKRLESLRSEAGPFGGTSARAFTGTGNRQYLTGLRLGGDRIVIMLDASTSMLDDDLVNVLRRRNMAEGARRNAPKWRRAVRTVEWLASQLPLDSRFQVVLFDETARVAVAGSEGKWLPVLGGRDLEAAMEAVKAAVPKGGTSLENAFMLVASMNPQPDNIYLVTDGLPTQGLQPVRSGVVDGRARERLFSAAIEHVPKDATVNTILMPMDGDPNAAAAYWILGQRSGGTMLAPPRDWP